ncbi:hypothetical protein [Psychroflexus sediminis]|uniref:Uncharacterized protein n=1 Tax=Psychroflexus sediminis TaxID=470826 RepID=A0A1G7YE18_9FLAO|nr:hypothetical protein [Psychroflexus sediminis]SDG94613.1 hypothetical protein SAMN04488027_1122 [Psychroflexus sediminis]
MNPELKNIKSSLVVDDFQIDLPDRFEAGIYLNFIRVDNFDKLFREAHKKFNQTDDIAEQKVILENELKVYKALSKHLKSLISGIENGTTKISLSYNPESKDFIDSTLSELFKINQELSFEKKVQVQTLRKLNQQLNETNQAIFELKNYQFSTYKHEEFLGGGFYLRFPKETIIYKEISIGNSKFGSSILYKDESQNGDKIDLLNMLAFFQVTPNFLLTKNKSFNEKLSNLYDQFDILDLLTLTSTKYFNDPKGEFRSLSSPIFKLYRNTKFIIFPDINFRELFNLYHSSLKQIEPLPRCVFLFRIVEYAKNYHYQQIFQTSNLELKDVIEYYYNEMLEHRFIPIYFLDYGSDHDHKTGELVKRRKTQYLNLMVELKRKSKQIVEYWNTHPYLKSKSLGQIIYNTGRNTVAHGGNGNQNINYDYANKYKHINDVNVFLELIARYIIELTNPDLKSVIYRKKDMYEKNCSHLRIMNEKQNVVNLKNNG